MKTTSKHGITAGMWGVGGGEERAEGDRWSCLHLPKQEAS